MGGGGLLLVRRWRAAAAERGDGDRGGSGMRDAGCGMRDASRVELSYRVPCRARKSVNPGKEKEGIEMRSGRANALSDGIQSTVAVRCSCSALSQQRQRQQQKCVERGEESSVLG